MTTCKAKYFLLSESGGVADADFPTCLIQSFISRDHEPFQQTCILPPEDLRSSPLAAGVDMGTKMHSRKFNLLFSKSFDDWFSSPDCALVQLPRSRFLKKTQAELAARAPIDGEKDYSSAWPWYYWAANFGAYTLANWPPEEPKDDHQLTILPYFTRPYIFSLELRHKSVPDVAHVFHCHWDGKGNGTATRLTTEAAHKSFMLSGPYAIVKIKNINSSLNFISCANQNVWACFNICEKSEATIYFTAPHVASFNFVCVKKYCDLTMDIEETTGPLTTLRKV